MDKKATYQRIAAFYDLLDLPFEKSRYRPVRERLFRGLSGDVLDAGVGTGRNLAHYPAGARVTGIDFSPAMLAGARSRQEKLGVNVELREMDVTQLQFADDSFDAIVATFLFCVLDADLQLPALNELRRVCKPDGSIHILEYAISEQALQRLSMKLWAPWVRFAYGAAFDRNTEQYVEAAGLELVEKTFLFKDILKLLRLKPVVG